MPILPAPHRNQATFYRRTTSCVLFALLICLSTPILSIAQTDIGTSDPEMAELLPSVEQRPQRELANPLTLLDRPVDPEVYRVGPGDKILVHILGADSRNHEVTVNPEGSMIIPSVGEVNVRGQTLADAKKTIHRSVRRLYPRAEITATLTAVRTFRIGVSGTVGNPGYRVVGAMTRCSEVLEAAGLLSNASSRRIELTRGDSLIRVDLLAFARIGDLSANPYVLEGDILHVPPTSSNLGTITVLGAVGTPGTIEFIEGESLGRVFELAGGLLPEANPKEIELVRFAANNKETYSVPLPRDPGLAAFSSIPLEADDRVFVRQRQDYRRKDHVTVTGEVMAPGAYPIVADSTKLADVVAAAGGPTINADLKAAQIYRPERERTDVDNLDRLRAIPVELRTRAENDRLLAHSITPPGRVVTNFVRLIAQGDTTYNIRLRPLDQIYIPPKHRQVNVTGRVTQPGLVAFRDGASLDYYLEQAGGFAWRADKKNVFLVKNQSGVAIKKSKVRSIEPGDEIVIPTKRDPQTWSTVKDIISVLGSVATVYLAFDQIAR